VSDRPTRILIVEDHRVLADGLELRLEREDDLEVVGVAQSVADGVRLAAEQTPDVVLMDYHLPDGTGADAARRILAARGGVAIVMLTAESSDLAIAAAIESGASGYLPKTLAADRVVDAVRRAAAGETVLPAGMLSRALAAARGAAERRARAVEAAADLTPRELEVLRLLGEGLDNRALAERLGVAYSTVRTHVENVMGKLGARSRLEAVAKAAEQGLLDR
jgi:DNA-binding NarL/FixJ family response regulator